jgi:CBS domain-containing protein
MNNREKLINVDGTTNAEDALNLNEEVRKKKLLIVNEDSKKEMY